MKVKKNKNRNIDRKREWDIKDLPRSFRRKLIKKIYKHHHSKMNPIFIKGCSILRTVRNGSVVSNKREFSV